jgi:hypothetical protein
MNNARPMSFGEKAVGLAFNPSGDPAVEKIKTKCADLIDGLYGFREVHKDNPEIYRMMSIAITDLQSAQMWAVKAVTWKY